MSFNVSYYLSHIWHTNFLDILVGISYRHVFTNMANIAYSMKIAFHKRNGKRSIVCFSPKEDFQIVQKTAFFFLRFADCAKIISAEKLLDTLHNKNEK